MTNPATTIMMLAVGAAMTTAAPLEASGPSPSHLLAGEGVGQIYPEHTDHAEEQRRHEAVERERQRGSGDDALFVHPGPLAGGGPRIAWYGVAAILAVSFGWMGLLLGRRRLLAACSFYGGLSALFYIAYAVTH